MSSPTALSHRAILTPHEVYRYLKHISFPTVTEFQDPDYYSHLVAYFQSSPLENLSTLLRHQLCTISFDSLVLHYSQHHTVSLRQDALFEKLVASGENGLGNRGGYCMENNSFFDTVLRTLGYETLTCGARVSKAANGTPGGGFLGW